MLYPQNGDPIVAIDSVTSLHLMYTTTVHSTMCVDQVISRYKNRRKHDYVKHNFKRS